MVSHTAIETIYRGFRFRSRLEARWAVFFDAAGIGWRYEPQGYRAGNGEPYLPDFLLFDWDREPTNLFAEVKGDPGAFGREHERMGSLHDWGGCLPGFENCLGDGRAGLMLLGEIPFPRSWKVVLHPVLQHDDGLFLKWCYFSPPNLGDCVRYQDRNDLIGDVPWIPLISVEHAQDWDTEPMEIEPPEGFHSYRTILDAYRMARGARFEHGERG